MQNFTVKELIERTKQELAEIKEADRIWHEQTSKQIEAMDTRIAELKELLRAECILDCGSQEEWHCLSCGACAARPELIKHRECRVAKALGL